MGLLATVLDKFEDDSSKDDVLIKSGTLRTTRATALVAVSVVATMALFNELAPEALGLDKVTPAQKFAGAIAVGFIWSIGSAADALARGIAATGKREVPSAEAAAYSVALSDVAADVTVSHGFRVLEPPLSVKLDDKAGEDELGWLAVATAIRAEGLQICLAKQDTVEWRSARDKNIKWIVSTGVPGTGARTVGAGGA